MKWLKKKRKQLNRNIKNNFYLSTNKIMDYSNPCQYIRNLVLMSALKI